MAETIKNHPIKIAVGTLATVILFSIYTTNFVLSSKGDMNTQIVSSKNIQDRLVEDVKKLEEDHKEEIDTLMLRCADNDIRFAEIQTDLAYIKVMMLEMKNSH